MSSDARAPVAVGGVGGSGTRLIARVLLDLGFYLGGDLNESLDNLWFTLLFKRSEVLDLSPDDFAAALTIFVTRMTGGGPLSLDELELVRGLSTVDRLQHPSEWLRERADSLVGGAPAPTDGPWGWKAPNTHIVVDRLVERLPGLRYIHVVRNGLDMAYSTNQNQLQFWGERFLGPGVEITPYQSLRFWHRVHRRVLELCEPLGERFLLLNYDRFCADPLTGLSALLDFLKIRVPPDQRERLASLARTPASVGRFKQHGLDGFDPQDVAFVASLGFDTRVD